jgi:hypothetical protein
MTPLDLIRVSTRVVAGSNTSTVTLRVVGGDEKGSLKYETVKYCRGDSDPKKKALARTILSSDRMLCKDFDRKCSFEKKILAVSLMGLGAKMN